MLRRRRPAPSFLVFAEISGDLGALPEKEGFRQKTEADLKLLNIFQTLCIYYYIF